ncbi:hypothetical protein Tco_0144370 [Tanacetum coccineum]
MINLTGSYVVLVAFNAHLLCGKWTLHSSRGRWLIYLVRSLNRDLHTFARHPSSLDANLAEAFQVQCNTSAPDWFIDTGASAHMTSDSAHLDAVASYSGNESVIFGNG